MANLRAIGFDGETIIYLLAEGTGTDLDPFVSSFRLVDQNLLATESGLTAIANLIPEFTFDGNRLTVKTELQQPLTLTELESVTVKVSEQNPLNISGLAKESKQDDLLTKLPSGLTVTGGRLLVDADVNLPVSYPVTGDFYPATQVVSGTVTANTGLNPLTDSQLRANPVQAEIINNVSVIGDLDFDKTGLATDTNQTTANATLSTISGKIPANLTVNATRLLVDGSGVIQPVIGTVTANTGLTQPLTDAQLRASNVNVTVGNFPVNQAVSLATLPPLATGSNVIGSIANTTFATTQSGAWTVDVNNFPTTQTVTGTVTANTGLNPLTDIQLRASAVGVAVSNFPTTQPISAASLPLPTDAATATNQATIIGHVDGIETALAGTLAVDTGLNQPLTDAQLRAASVGMAVDNFPAQNNPAEYINVRQTDGNQFSTPRLTKFSESLTARNISILNYKPTWGASILRYARTTVGTGASIGERLGEFELRSGTDATGLASIQTLQRGQYQAGQQGQFGMGVRISAVPVGSQFAEWGYFDEQNGYGFGIDSTSVYTFSLFNGVKTKVYSASWNKDKLDGTGSSGLVLDLMMGMVCHIDFIWYGYGDIDYGFFPYSSVDRYVKYVLANNLKIDGSVSTVDPNQPLRAVVNNGGLTASNFSLFIGGHQFSVVGGETSPKRRHLGEFIADYQLANNTVRQPILAIRRKATFGDSNRINSVKCFLRSISVSATGGDVKWILAQNAVTNNITVPYTTPTDWLPSETAVETKKTAGTAITTTAAGYPVIYLATTQGENVERIFEFDLDLTIDTTNEWVLYAQRNAGAVTIRQAAIHWVEEW